MIHEEKIRKASNHILDNQAENIVGNNNFFSDNIGNHHFFSDKLKGEIAIHVHLDTLKRVEIFQNTEVDDDNDGNDDHDYHDDHDDPLKRVEIFQNKEVTKLFEPSLKVGLFGNKCVKNSKVKGNSYIRLPV